MSLFLWFEVALLSIKVGKGNFFDSVKEFKSLCIKSTVTKLKRDKWWHQLHHLLQNTNKQKLPWLSQASTTF